MEHILEKAKKKRGRPRKYPLSSTKEESITRTVTPKNDDIILEMSITMDDFYKHYPEEQSEKRPKSNYTEKSTSNIFTLNELSTSSPINKTFGKNVQANELLLKLKDSELKIKNQQKEILKLKKMIDDAGLYNSSSTKVHEIHLNLIDCTTEKTIVVEKTNIACWWCTLQFDTMPCFIPNKQVDNMYHVFGCFCSFNCAASYNFTCLDDYKVWNRYSLLKKMYQDTIGYDSEILNAPPKETLKKYGGKLTEQEYKQELQFCSREYRLILPPMTSTIPILEERIIDGKKRKYYNNTTFNGFDGLKLKRTKPLPSTHNTIMDTMGVRL